MITDINIPDPVDPVFISYRQKDGTKIVAELAWLLRAAGIPVWRDRDDLPPGDTEARLKQAIAAGISGGVLVVTPDVVKSRVVKTLEAPCLMSLHQAHEGFVLGIVNSVENKSGGMDYTAPDRLLEARPGTLSGVDQYPTDRAGLLTMIRGIVWHRIAFQREQIQATDQVLHLSLQTRNTPQVYDRTGDQLDIRIRPSNHERLPSAQGLRDLRDTIGLLPDVATRSGAIRIRVQGGAHLSVAFAVGAALPSSRIGHMEVLDRQGATWASGGEARLISPSHVRVAAEATNSTPTKMGRLAVAMYIDFRPERSDTAFVRYLEENETFLAAWCHLVSAGEALLESSDAGELAADVAAHIRQLSTDNENAVVHILLRCPFPIALLIARLTNTMRFVVYEWDDTDPAVGNDYRPRFVPTLRVRTSASSGVIEEVLLAEPS